MRHWNVTPRLLAACALGIVTTSAGAAPRYEHANLFGTGYSDRQITPGTWDVRAASATPDGGHAIALYRAAELARDTGATELRIVRQKIIVLSRGNRFGGSMMFVREIANLRVRAIRSDVDRVACEEKEARRCVTIPTARILAQFGPSLGQEAGPYQAAMAGQPVVRVGMALPRAFSERLAEQSAATPPLASAPSTPARPLTPYQLGRQQGRAALAASGERVDD